MALIALIGMAVEGGGLAVFTRLLKPMIDQMFAQKNAYYIFWMPIWIIIIFVVRALGTFASSYGISYIGRNVVQAIQYDVFAAYLRLPAAFFGAEPSGQQVSRITYTSEQVSSTATDAVKVAVTEGVTVIGMLYVMLSNSAYLTLALLL
ncbi:MAG: lipid ABC transporter permease/ATP-binding protein, partial [Xanthomonadaceae bacterium]|nr:lipid ABC transporter permease/ATP-binding protein [Xanthomonadaceae bacterium]